TDATDDWTAEQIERRARIDYQRATGRTVCRAGQLVAAGYLQSAVEGGDAVRPERRVAGDLEKRLFDQVHAAGLHGRCACCQCERGLRVEADEGHVGRSRHAVRPVRRRLPDAVRVVVEVNRHVGGEQRIAVGSGGEIEASCGGTGD